MQQRTTRFSRRHLLALGTFLVPLTVLAVLGWNELRRSGAVTEDALEREARQFLASAQQAIEQRFELQVSKAMTATERLLLRDGSETRAALALRNDEGVPSTLDVLLLDEQAGLVSPSLPTYTVTLPFAREPVDDQQGKRIEKLSQAEALIANYEFHHAIRLLEDLIKTLGAANPPDEDGRRSSRPDYVEAEIHARFRLATCLRALGETDRALDEFRQVERIASQVRGRFRRVTDMPAIELLTSSAIADLSPPAERLKLLRAIAEGEYGAVTDGLAGAIANRLAATFPASDPDRETVDRYLVEENQRAGTREFAGNYELFLKSPLRVRISWTLAETDGDVPIADRIVTKIDDHTSLLEVAQLPPELRDQLQQAAFVAVHFDLDVLLEPALAAYRNGDGNFVLAVSVTEPLDVEIVPPPADVAPDYEPPTATTSFGLTLRVYPADSARLVTEAEAAHVKRVLLVLALFLTAVGGALWSWRSVSRETELAALKIDLVSRVSHELKTPLALIRMYGETLGMGRTRDAEQAREFGAIISRESERLTTLIQRILDFSRQQAGTLTYSPVRHDLGELLREIAYAYAPHLEAKGVFLVDSLPLGIEVDCDKSGLEGAIVNLLENTTKYGREGEHEQEVELLLERRGDQAVIEVKDHGRGIPDGEHDRVFDGFYRATNSGEVRGAGLGLGIVQHFARAHGGDIVALPRDGGGTIMRMLLPVKRPSASPPATSDHRTRSKDRPK